MDYGAYAAEALTLLNHRLGSVEDMLAMLEARSWLAERATGADLAALQRLQSALAEVVERSEAGDQPGVVSRLNSLLAQHPTRPYIGGHDAQSWHLHVSHADASTAEIVTSEALFGLALLVTESGADRLGWCTAPTCGRAFVDASRNRSRRFCSQRCATRVNVAAHRSRTRAR